MTVIIYPRISEKAYAAVNSENTYVFNVPLNANKIEIKKAVEELYSVNVESVNVVRMIGKKTRRIVSKSGRRINGRRSNFKKAYVVVKKGQTIPVFTATEEDDK